MINYFKHITLYSGVNTMKKYILTLSLCWFSAQINGAGNDLVPNRSRFETLYDLNFNQNNFFQAKNALLGQALELEGYRLLIDSSDPIFPYIDLLHQLTKQKMQEYEDAKLIIMQELIAELNSFFPVIWMNYQEVANILKIKEPLIQYLITTDSHQKTRELLKKLVESTKQSVKNFEQIAQLVHKN